MVFILSALWWISIRGLWKLPDGRDWLRGKLALVLIGGVMLSKSLIEFSVNGQGCVPSLLLDLRPNYGGGNEDNGDLLQKVPCMHCCTQCLQPYSRPLLTHASAGDCWTLMGMSGSVSCGSLLHFLGSSWAQDFVSALKSSISPALCKFWWFYGGINGDFLQKGLCHTQFCCTQSPCSRPLLTLLPQEALRHSSCLVSVGLVCAFGLSQVWAAQTTRCLASRLYRVGHAS